MYFTIQVNFDYVLRLNQGWSHAACNEKSFIVGGMTRTNVTKSIEHTFIDQDVIGQCQFFQ